MSDLETNRLLTQRLLSAARAYALFMRTPNPGDHQSMVLFNTLQRELVDAGRAFDAQPSAPMPPEDDLIALAFLSGALISLREGKFLTVSKSVDSVRQIQLALRASMGEDAFHAWWAAARATTERVLDRLDAAEAASDPEVRT